MAEKMSKRDIAKCAIKWAANTTIDSDKIANHFGLNKTQFRKVAKDIRDEQTNRRNKCHVQ